MKKSNQINLYLKKKLRKNQSLSFFGDILKLKGKSSKLKAMRSGGKNKNK